MSNVFLVLAIVGVVGAVILLVIAVEAAISDRRQTVKVLQSQVGSVGSPVREEELSGSFTDRAVVPFVAGVGRVARSATPVDTRKRLDRKLVLAGNPVGWDAERVAGFKIAAAVGGLLLGLLVTRSIGAQAGWFLVFTIGGAVAGFFAPDAILDGKVKTRQKDIRHALPDVMDLLTISVEAGLSLNTALAQVVANVPGVLSQEIARMLQEIQLGVPRVEAFRSLADRTDVDELNAFVLAMTQADIFGVSIGGVLRAQSHEGRVKRRQRAERLAMQTPVKMTFPLILCILPALLIVVIGPGAIRIMQNLFK